MTRPAKLFRFPYGDDGGDRADDFRRVFRDREFTGPDRGDRGPPRADWPWMLDVADWTTDDISELRARFEATVSDAGRADEVVLFHDAGNSPALFEAFVGWLDDGDHELTDPLELLP